MSSLDIAPAPEDCSGPEFSPPQGLAPVSGDFPVGAKLHRLEIGLQAIQLSPYHAGPPDPSSRTPGPTTGCVGMLLSPFSFEARSATRPRDITSNPSLLQ